MPPRPGPSLGLRSPVLATLAALACAGCPLEPAPLPTSSGQVHDVPYAGVAFPDRRAALSMPAGGLAVVTDMLSDTLSVIDPDAPARIASLPVGRDPLGIDGPAGLAVDVQGGFIYVALSYPVKFVGAHAGHTGHGVDPGYVQKLALADLAILGETAIDAEPTAIALSDDRERLVVSHLFEAGLAAVAEDPADLDLARARLTLLDPTHVGDDAAPDPETIRVCLGASGVAVSRPDAARAYVACFGEDAVAIAALGDPEAPVVRVSLGPDVGPPGKPALGPYAVAISPDGATVAIVSTLSKDVRFLDVATRAMLPDRTAKLLARPRVPVFADDGSRIYVPVQEPDALVVLDPATGAEVDRHDFSPGECPFPQQVVVRGRDPLLVLCAGSGDAPGRVVELDASTLGPKGAVDVGLFPSALALAHGGGR